MENVSPPVRSVRCAVHPTRVAADGCPTCGRPRCGADARRYGDAGCAACGGKPILPLAGAGATALEWWLRAAIAALAVAFVGGWIAAEYVDTHYFATVAPGLVGLACAWAAAAATSGLPLRIPLTVSCGAALLATGLSFRLVPGGQNLFLPPGHRLPPYVAAVVGVAAWRVLFGPSRRS